MLKCLHSWSNIWDIFTYIQPSLNEEFNNWETYVSTLDFTILLFLNDIIDYIICLLEISIKFEICYRKYI